MKNIEVNKDEILVSFDIVLLYTMIPIEEAIDVINHMTDADTANLVRTCLKSTYFSYQGNIYEQIHEVTMGSHLSPVIPNIYMEHFKMKAINSFPFTSDESKRYVDDIFAKWSNGINKLHDFLSRKDTHTDKYLHANSHHHPAQKVGIIKCLLREQKDPKMQITSRMN